MKLLLLLISLACQVHAADAPPEKLIKEMEGVYKRRFTNGAIDPGKPDTSYQSEDIVEIVRYDDTHIYVRAQFEFYNGHSCSIWGIAGYENRAFVYHDPAPSFDGGPSCTLTVRQTEKQITFMDRLTPEGAATCRFECGVRGSFSGVSIPRQSRRPIRYMDLIKGSRQYRQAIDKFQHYEASLPAKDNAAKEPGK